MRIKWLLLLAIFFMTLTFILCYTLSKSLGHISFPTISQVGNFEPESSIFSWGVTISSFLLLLVIISKKQQFERCLERMEEEPVLWHGVNRLGQKLEISYFVKLNLVSVWFGVAAMVSRKQKRNRFN
jgi:hypothetical protein